MFPEGWRAAWNALLDQGEPVREVDSWVRTTGQTFLGGHPEPAILMCQARHGQSWHKWLSSGRTWASSVGGPERS